MPLHFRIEKQLAVALICHHEGRPLAIEEFRKPFLELTGEIFQPSYVWGAVERRYVRFDDEWRVVSVATCPH